MKKYPLIISFLLFPATAIVGGFSAGFGGNRAFAAQAAKDFTGAEYNPALLAALPGVVGGAYWLPDVRTNGQLPLQPGSETSFLGGFAGIKFRDFGFLADYQRDAASRHNSDHEHSGAGLGFSWSPGDYDHVGVFASGMKSFGDHLSGRGALGYLHEIPLKEEIFYGFGFYEIKLGASLGSLQAAGLSEALPLAPAGAWQAQVFASKLLNVYFDQTIQGLRGFSSFYFLQSIRFHLFDLIGISGGFYGSDILKYEFGFAGLDIGREFGPVGLRVFASYGAPNFDFVQPQSNAGTALAAYGYYRISLLKKKTETVDTDLTFFVKPGKIVTPNEDGQDDYVGIFMTHASLSEVRDWNLVIEKVSSATKTKPGQEMAAVIQPEINKTLKNGNYPFPRKVFWRCLDYRGQRVDDGEYTLQLIVIRPDGTKSHWQLGQIIVDAHRPEFNHLMEKKNIRIGTDNLEISLKDRFGDMKKYDISLFDSRSNAVYAESRTSDGEVTVYRWNGQILPGKYILSGSYSMAVKAEDAAGNSREITVDNIRFYEADELSLDVPYLTFSPNGDGKADKLPIGINSAELGNLKEWKIRFISENERKEVRLISGGNYLPPQVFWDGEDARGGKLGDGRYQFYLETLAPDGTQRKSLVYDAILDTHPPVITISSPNRDFTPDSDGYDDEYRIDILSEDVSPIIAYEMSIDNPGKKKSIRKLKARDDLPGFLLWDGLNDSGLNVSAYDPFRVTIRAMDAAGNLGESNVLKGQVGLTLERGSKNISLGSSFMTLRFPNLKFKRGASVPGKSSLYILDNLAVYLRRQRSVRATVVGHTDNRGGREYNEKLSLQRAEFFREYLIKRGVPAGKLDVRGAGQDEPLFPNTTVEYRSRNRRIELIVRKAENADAQ